MKELQLGLGLGLVVGAAVAFLFAPSSGQELWTKLQERGKVVFEEAPAEDSDSEAEVAA